MSYQYTQEKAQIILRPGPTKRKSWRKNTDWSKLSNDDLKFALDVLSLHYSPFEVDAANEIERRIVAGTWLQLDSPVPTMAPGMPGLFYIWPFSLLWSQRPKR
jgi:hypothetical protein